MYTVVPGKSGALVARVEVSATASKPAQKQAPAPKLAPMVAEPKMHMQCVCSCKNTHAEFSRKDTDFNLWTGKEHRKCAHSNLRRRGRRAVVIYH